MRVALLQQRRRASACDGYNVREEKRERSGVGGVKAGAPTDICCISVMHCPKVARGFATESSSSSSTSSSWSGHCMLARVHRHALHELHTDPLLLPRLCGLLMRHMEKGEVVDPQRGVMHSLEGPGGGLLESHEARNWAVLCLRHDSATSLSMAV